MNTTANIATASPEVISLLNNFDERMEDNNNLIDEETVSSLAAGITSPQSLQDGLGEIKKRVFDYNEAIDNCKKNIDMWRASKDIWTNKKAGFQAVLTAVMNNLLPNTGKIAGAGAKLSVTRRSSLEVDEEWLINTYRPLADELQEHLPSYVKVKLDIDKTKLMAHVKTDSELLVNFPERIHTKESTSITVK